MTESLAQQVNRGPTVEGVAGDVTGAVFSAESVTGSGVAGVAGSIAHSSTCRSWQPEKVTTKQVRPSFRISLPMMRAIGQNALRITSPTAARGLASSQILTVEAGLGAVCVSVMVMSSCGLATAFGLVNFGRWFCFG